jgi:hypothetical protein
MDGSAARLMPDAWWQNDIHVESDGRRSTIRVRNREDESCRENAEWPRVHRESARVWLIDSSRAILNGLDLGPAGALAQQARLNDFFIPQRGLFAVAEACLQTPRRTSSMHSVNSELKTDHIKELS